MKRPLRLLLMLIVLALIGAGFWMALRPKPLPVDTVVIGRAPMQVGIDAEGVTRVRDVYEVSSPIAGHLDRIALDEGDRVVANDTVIASIHPLEPPFLDARTRAELNARVKAAESAVALARVERSRAVAALALARSERNRAEELRRYEAIADSEIEKLDNAVTLARAQLAASEAAIALREAELATAEASLTPASGPTDPADQECCVTLRAPVDGIVLSVQARSEQAITTGSRIAEIGDPRRLEGVVDILSADAVRVTPGDAVRIDEWGGDSALLGTVRRVEPAAFTKVSALGIEEQRVNVIIDLPETPPALGHGYRLFTHLIVWQAADVLQLPIGALFRSNGDWAVFVVEEQRARLKTVEIGQMNDTSAEITGGLEAGETVVLYPNDLIADGKLVTPRETGT